MTQIETVDLEPLAEGGEVRLLRVPVGRVDWKARGDDDVRTGSQEFEGGLKADLDPGAGDECVVPAEISGLFALGIVEVAARIAQRVVVAMHLCEGFLADVAGALPTEFRAAVEFFRLRPLEPERRIDRGAALNA